MVLAPPAPRGGRAKIYPPDLGLFPAVENWPQCGLEGLTSWAAEYPKATKKNNADPPLRRRIGVYYFESLVAK